MLKLKCLKELIGLTQVLLKDRTDLLKQVPTNELTTRLLDMIELICDFSIN